MYTSLYTREMETCTAASNGGKCNGGLDACSVGRPYVFGHERVFVTTRGGREIMREEMILRFVVAFLGAR